MTGATVLTGSFNFTKAAEESNAENLLVIRDAPELVEKYRANFKRHLAHSSPYEGDSAAPALEAPVRARPQASTEPQPGLPMP